jgi:hypothetical protein
MERLYYLQGFVFRDCTRRVEKVEVANIEMVAAPMMWTIADDDVLLKINRHQFMLIINATFWINFRYKIRKNSQATKLDTVNVKFLGRRIMDIDIGGRYI